MMSYYESKAGETIMMRSFAAAWSSTKERRNTLTRVGLWFGCVVVSAAVLAAFFSAGGIVAVFGVFSITLITAFPVACLYLPVVLGFKNGQGNRSWIMIGVGILIGPAFLSLFKKVQELRGVDPDRIFGDPLAFSYFSDMIFSVIVGFLATCLYVFSLSYIASAIRRASQADSKTENLADHL